MKAMPLLLSLLISSFSLQTCLDVSGFAPHRAEASVCHDNASAKEPADPSCQDPGESHHGDDCAPGCHCLCCGMVYLSSSAFPVEKTREAVVSFQQYTPSLHFADFHASIWQPPRLG